MSKSPETRLHTQNHAKFIRLSLELLRAFFHACLIACVATWAFVTDARAAGEGIYPSRTIHIIVPTAAGGAGDTLARYLGERLGVALRNPVVIENRPGAGGFIGTEYAARAPADGYTILFGATPTHMIAPLLAQAPFEQRDFTPVFNAAYTTSVITVSERVPVTTLAEFVAYAKARPGVLNFASSGLGSANYIDMEVLNDIAGLNVTHIAYRGTADGYRALAADEVQVMSGAITSAMPSIVAGKARPLVVLTDVRSPLLPDVPTLAQAGFPGVDVRKWQGFLVPAGTPEPIVTLLNVTFQRIMRERDVRRWIERQGFEVAGGSAASFANFLEQDERKWRAIVTRLRLTPAARPSTR